MRSCPRPAIKAAHGRTIGGHLRLWSCAGNASCQGQIVASPEANPLRQVRWSHALCDDNGRGGRSVTSRVRPMSKAGEQAAMDDETLTATPTRRSFFRWPILGNCQIPGVGPSRPASDLCACAVLALAGATVRRSQCCVLEPPAVRKTLQLRLRKWLRPRRAEIVKLIVG